MAWLEALLAAAAGLAGGLVSTLAGNGTTVTLPALDLLGLPEDVANGTNRLALLAFGIMGTFSFHRRGLIDWPRVGLVAVPTALGTVAGSFVAVDIGEAALDAVVVVGLLLALALLLARPSRWLEGKEGEIGPFGWGQAVAYLAAGFYAGLIVVGSGFFFLVALVMVTGYDVVRGLAAKAVLLLVVGLISLPIFVETDEVDWAAGVPMMLGAAVGVHLAVRLVVLERAKVWVYRLVALVIILAILHAASFDAQTLLRERMHY